MNHTLAGKVVFVTGASVGIGEAVAREAARRGGKVVLAARRLNRIQAIADELGRAGHDALAVCCDVTRDGDLQAAVRASQALGPLDLLIANPGFGIQGRFDKLSLDDYRRQFETNILGVMSAIHAGLADLKRTRGAIQGAGQREWLPFDTWLVRQLHEQARGTLAVRVPATRAQPRWRKRDASCAWLHRERLSTRRQRGPIS